ncbi:hypothetical protein B0T20DRAFT_354946 [Sordaria brevicollis]|uniref:DUF7730 domain-containing protein n=1 Tax=Sordaria brevicollis TaxID=83679 RepID=A0AAE0PE14_SORBR|nr:hypothetical protein B0T20DRAFT_354946 [Sordaria brevicollis]
MAPSCELAYTGRAPSPTMNVSQKSQASTFARQLKLMGHNIGQAVIEVKQDDRRRISFMDLAVEIRLRIYDYVYESHSIRHSKLPPWYLTQGSGRHILKPVKAKATIKPSSPDDNKTNSNSYSSTRELLSAHRPMNYITTALLLACRQIYYEARTIPFHENEFVFPAWHDVNSVQIARDFLSSRLCADWQRQSIRYVRIDLDLSNDKDNGTNNSESKAEMWKELCSAINWGTSLRGMRLCIDCKDEDLRKGGSFAPAALDENENGVIEPEEEQSSPFAWILRGLVKLRSLRTLDVEIKRGSKYMTDDEKVGWCRLLEEVLNSSSSRRSLRERDDEEEEKGRRHQQKVSVMCAQTSYDPLNLEQVFGKISYPMMVWPLYTGF